jgi:hypothetical protein
MKKQLNEIKRMQQLAGLLKENFEDSSNEDSYVPYQFDDEKGIYLYKQYEKSYQNSAWRSVDGSYEKIINLRDLLGITGMSLSELEEIGRYGDESWSIFIDKEKGTVTEFND